MTWRFTRVQYGAPHWVYRLFDADGTLLYIGMTADMEKRLFLHLSSTNPAGYSEEIRTRYASHTVEPHPDWHAAHAAEIAAIYAEMPEINRQHNHQRWRWEGRSRKWVAREQVPA